MSIRMIKIPSLLVLMLAVVLPVFAQEEAASTKADAAKKAANPICAMFAVPIEYDHYEKVGPYDGTMDVVTLKPVIPIAINENWNLVSRTIVPYVWQDGIVPEKATMSGIELDTKEQLGYKYAGKKSWFLGYSGVCFYNSFKSYVWFSLGDWRCFRIPG